jgi:hypothetical protein
MDTSSYVAKALTSIAPQLTKQLRVAAKTAGWPEKIIKSISISTNNGQIAVMYPEKLKSDVEDLEYGNGDVPPAPVIRTFVDKNKNFIDGVVAEASIDALFKAGVLP